MKVSCEKQAARGAPRGPVGVSRVAAGLAETRSWWKAARVRSTRLVLIRHAQTAMNGGSPDPVMCGWLDLPLTAIGEQQAAALEHRVGAEAVYASPLRRARDTARHCTDGAELWLEPGLREIGCGRLEGVPLREIARAYPEAWARNAAETDDDFRWPGGESYAELRRRVLAAIAAIAARHPAARIAVVTHTGAITQLLGHLTGQRPARWSAHRVGNASITEIDWAHGRGTVRAFDVRDHLPPRLRT
jgi:broad specificity phosphatase PhoE